MLKKLLFTAAILSGIVVTSNAQSFTFDVPNPLIANTSGGTEPLVMDQYIKNITAAPTADTFQITWSIFSESYPDANWKLISLCDNMLCYNAGPDLVAGVSHTSNKINPGTRGNFKADFEIPTTAANGVGILKVLVGIPLGQSDTMVYQVNKTPTGISVVNITDERVSIYPNPASGNILVRADKALNAANLSIVSITGQVVYNKAFNADKDTENVSITSFAKGTYLVRLTDTKGQLITSRKFIKE